MSFIMGLVVLGFLIAIIALRGGNPAMLLDYKAMLLVAGGTLGSMLLTFPLADFRRELSVIFRLLRAAPKPKKLIDQISQLAQKARKNGILALEGSEKEVSDPILQKGLLLITGSADHAAVEGILQKESENLERQEKSAQDFFDRLSILAPGIGMVGTLIEIVQMLYAYKGPQQLAPEIGKALLPIVYAALLSYIVFMPLAARVKVGAERHRMLRELAVEGVLAIQAGEPPHLVEQRLAVFLPNERRGANPKE